MLRFVCLYLLLLLFFEPQLYAQYADIDTAAWLLVPTTLQTYKALVDSENLSAMGFDSLSQVKRATISQPMRIYSIGLVALRTYQQGASPFTLLGMGSHVIFPVAVDNQVRSSIEMQKAGGVWTPSSYGGANLVKLLADMRQNKANSLPIHLNDFFVVRISAFNLYFIAYVRTPHLMLVPVQNNEILSLQAGQIYPAEQLFLLLRSFAQTHKGLPG
jgi:hypothetical protein